jgi:hypothetical protein
MQLEQSMTESPKPQLPAEEQNKRLHVLVGDLLKTNQELRFRVAFLERQAESLERGLKSATAWSGLIF